MKNIDKTINYFKYASKSTKWKTYAKTTNITQNMHLYTK